MVQCVIFSFVFAFVLFCLFVREIERAREREIQKVYRRGVGVERDVSLIHKYDVCVSYTF